MTEPRPVPPKGYTKKKLRKAMLKHIYAVSEALCHKRFGYICVQSSMLSAPLTHKDDIVWAGKYLRWLCDLEMEYRGIGNLPIGWRQLAPIADVDTRLEFLDALTDAIKQTKC